MQEQCRGDISLRIADRHNVEIDVVSREGEGSTFTLSFPLDDRNDSAQIIA